MAHKGFQSKLPKRSKKSFTTLTFACAIFFIAVSVCIAEDLSSTNFIVRDPVVTVEGGRHTSTSFEYFSSSGQFSTGENSSTSFDHLAGFLYFPVATSPIVTATAGDAQVQLSWTSSVGTFGNITNYELGVATVSGGPYTFQSIGNVLSYTKTGLTNNTPYYFVIKAYAGTLPVITGSEVTSTPIAAVGGGGGGGGGGGWGGGSTQGGTGTGAVIIFSGRAYPGNDVILLKDGQILTQAGTNSDATFEIELSNLSIGTHTFSFYSEDDDGRRSPLLNFPVTITADATIHVTGIFIAPTIAVDKSQVKKGDDIVIFGQSATNADILIQINSSHQVFLNTTSDTDGVYLYHFNTSVLELGDHSTKSKASIGSQLVSNYGATVGFEVGNENIPIVQGECGKADLNCDHRVNLIDFSIAAFWYNRLLDESFSSIEAQALNGDGKVDITDFSIMAYYWTG